MAHKILVTGATGYLGAALLPRLREAGFPVLGLARTPEAARKIESLEAIPVMGDLRDPASLGAACRQADGVVHCAMHWGAEAGQIDRAAVSAMLDHLAGTEKTFVYTSGTWVMGSTGGRLAGEMFALKPPPLVAWRPAVERMTLDAVERKVRVIVIRPGSVYGHGGGTLGKIASGRLPMIGDGENHISFVHVDDLAGLYLGALERSPSGELFLGVAGQPVKWKDLAAAAGRTGRISLEEARNTMGGLADCLVLDQRIGSTKAGRVLGWIARGPSPLAVVKSGQ
jgi:nucleoside-diphosphate-sugar epimerase